MKTSTIIEIINQYGFATIAAIGMGWFIYFIYKYVTTQIKKKLGEMHTVLIALIDRVRMLDNDIIRLRSKVNTVLELREKEKSTCTKVDSPKLLVLFSTKAELLTMLRSSITDVLLSAATGVVD